MVGKFLFHRFTHPFEIREAGFFIAHQLKCSQVGKGGWVFLNKCGCIAIRIFEEHHGFFGKFVETRFQHFGQGIRSSRILVLIHVKLKYSLDRILFLFDRIEFFSVLHRIGIEFDVKFGVC